ncbi:L,D-transpeptidase [Methylocapsa aurea]|uniref:L,D-transpeptidase n=1 Tax=Methylocapsa aurea TaxID=663610 RepID=UPI000A02F20A|nr:L,D-transpeptidase [Methylocapsa aurea]
MNKLRTGGRSIFRKVYFSASLLAALGVCAVLIIAANSAQARENVAFSQSYPPGTIIIKQSERRLYFTTGGGTAIRYPIAIGRSGRAWQGETFVQGKYVEPAWSAPAVVRQDHPNFPAVIPGGSPRNPMGAAALTLNLSEVAIHGTTQSMRKSVGTAASYGCIRMYNEDVVDLFHRVQVGTRVVAVP